MSCAPPLQYQITNGPAPCPHPPQSQSSSAVPESGNFSILKTADLTPRNCKKFKQLYRQDKQKLVTFGWNFSYQYTPFDNIITDNQEQKSQRDKQVTHKKRPFSRRFPICLHLESSPLNSELVMIGEYLKEILIKA